MVWALALLCYFSFSYKAVAETPVITNPTFGDDTYVHVPLQFGFPFYGEVFTNSWMHSNGVVSFLNPTAPMNGGNPGAWAFCCSGLHLSPENVQLGPNFRYFIAPLWTDLYPTQQSTFETEGTSQYQIYRWNNIAEISNFNNLNSFSLEIRPSGYIGVDYSLVNITNQIVSAGIVGDPTLGQMQSFFFGVPGASLSNWSVTDTPVDYCLSNPLYSPQCPGYNEAYHDQQCSVSPLYATTCFGYQQAFYTQQCSLDPLYDSGCFGYTDAFYTQQCSLDPLYDIGCIGYQQAYFNQQCTISSLYDENCPGYGEAFFNQQCSIDPFYNQSCGGYDQAFFNQQCSLNQLYSANCPGYQQAYYDQQCSLNPLYDSGCPNYNIVSNATQTPSTEVAQLEVSVNDDGTISTDVPLVSDPVVNSVLTKKTEVKSKEEEATSSTKTENNERRQTARRPAPKPDPEKQSESEKEFEKEIASQAATFNTMALVPGFDAYTNSIIPDLLNREMQRQYNRPPVDNARAQRQLNAASDRLHQEMINEQYKR